MKPDPKEIVYPPRLVATAAIVSACIALGALTILAQIAWTSWRAAQ